MKAWKHKHTWFKFISLNWTSMSRRISCCSAAVVLRLLSNSCSALIFLKSSPLMSFLAVWMIPSPSKLRIKFTIKMLFFSQVVSRHNFHKKMCITYTAVKSLPIDTSMSCGSLLSISLRLLTSLCECGLFFGVPSSETWYKEQRIIAFEVLGKLRSATDGKVFFEFTVLVPIKLPCVPCISL